MIKQCQNCKIEFEIDSDDLEFYKKIDVPPPTFCSECRMQRQLAFRNERTLHRNKCAATGKSIIAGFAPDLPTGQAGSPIKVFDRDYWWSDAWDPLGFGFPYDFSKPFFAQYQKLIESVPMPSVFNSRTVNCEYTNHTGEFKDAYLVSASWGGENVAYASRVQDCNDSFDVFILMGGSSRCYEVVASLKMYNSSFCEKCENCTDCLFLYECKGCNNCFGSTNLRNKFYYIFNQPYSKEDYFNKIKEMDLGSFANLERVKQKFEELKLKALRKYANIVNSEISTGDDLANVFNCKNCFVCTKDMRNCKYVHNSLQLQDGYDCYGAGAASDLMYESFDSGVQASRLCFDAVVYGGTSIYYSYNCHGCQELFACIGLRNKSYCIFNQQYSKEEYRELRAKIIEHMMAMPYIDKKGRKYGYGEFFPVEISPFAYNETISQDFFPLTKEQAITAGYEWRDHEMGKYQITRQAKYLPDNIAQVTDDMLKEIVGCANCGHAYRFIKKELDFLHQQNLPVPRLCPECRFQRRFRLVNFPRLYSRFCACLLDEAVARSDAYKNTTKHFHGEKACPNVFETTYAPNRPETIYCEQCYNAEVV